MKFTLRWLKEYLDFKLSPQELAKSLTMVGLEVESIEYLGKGLEDIVVAEILDIKPHPNASKLVICTVTDGTRHYNIVCGARNMKVGDKVALARAGVTLPPSPKFPEGIAIQATRIRGELSEGMLCAENELGIGEEGEGILILPETTKPGSKLIDVLDLDDTVIEVGVTPNRPDCLSVVGIARELAAILGKEIKYPDYNVLEGTENIEELVSVEVLDQEGCPRYSCRVITDVRISPSPAWLKNRLRAVGIRSINNVVDVTNLVLLELGQPLHAFDYDLIHERRVVVRKAQQGEVIETLDKVRRNLDKEDLLICDAKNPIALAGIMGGLNTEISEDTRNILLESAYFNPVRIRRTSKRLNLKTESSYRFERGVDPNGVVKALDRASELIRRLAGGNVAKGKIDIYPAPIYPKEIWLSLDRLNSTLGTDIKAEEVKKILKGLELEITEDRGNEFLLSVPTFRVDISREVDLVEEVARHWGYEKIPVTLPLINMKTQRPEKTRVLENRIKEVLTSLGFLEVINYSFEDPETLALFSTLVPLRILNPLSKESSVMRTSLLAGILKNVSFNLNHQVQDIRIFEIGKVYIPEDNSLPKEITKLAAAATGRGQPELWNKEEFDLFYLKGIVERILEAISVSGQIKFEEAHGVKFLHPGKSARLVLGNETVGLIGEIHPDLREHLDILKPVYVFEVDFDRLVSLSTPERRFSSLPKFPSLRRDISIVVDENLPVAKILNEIKKVESELIEEVSIFDVFKGGSIEKGKKSVTVSVILRASDRTLTDEEANKIQETILGRLNMAFGAELRKT